MTTFGTLEDRIASEVRAISTAAASDIQTQIRAAILSAIKHHERERFYFNEARVTLTTSSSAEYYTSAELAMLSTTPQIDSIRCLISNGDYRLVRRDLSWFEDIAQQHGTVGDPTDWTYYGQQLRLYPAGGSTARNLEILYVSRFATLSATADTNGWLTDAEEMIRARAKWDLYSNVVRNVEKATMMKGIELDALAALRRETVGRISSGFIRPTQF